MGAKRKRKLKPGIFENGMLLTEGKDKQVIGRISGLKSASAPKRSRVARSSVATS